MNLVRLGMIAGLCAVAYYAMTIYAQIPTTVADVPTDVKQVITMMCPQVANKEAGFGMVLVALTAIGGAIAVAAVDLFRRVY